MTTWKLEHNDVIEWAKNYDGPPFHAALLDPPYHLTTPARFGKPGSAPAKGDVYARASKGFMGTVWDGGGIAFDPATWAALAQHLYPGAFIMAFAGSRGYHRMACAMEDAGLIIHPAMGWLTLSGFPKATRIKGYGSPAFKGHRYGLQALKPAFEFIAVAQVPYEGRPVDSIVATGAGALNIEQARIRPTYQAQAIPQLAPPRKTTKRTQFNGSTYQGRIDGSLKDTGFADSHPAGRWPSNFLLQHHPEDNGECHPDCPVRLFDEQAGESVSKAAPRGGTSPNPMSWRGERADGDTMAGYDDSGPASRMFYQSDWAYEVAEQLANAEPVRYEPKVSGAERDAGLDDLETRTRHRVNAGGLEKEPRFAPTQVKNNHPTLKPISLTKYLATLLLPPAAYAPRRILVPFSGVSSEMIGCVLAGWESVTGIESNAAYVSIGEPRLRWWSQWPGWGQTDVDTILAAAKDKEDDRQLSLFEAA